MDKKFKILIVDDRIENLKYLNELLKYEYDVRATTDSKLAINSVKNEIPDLILLDIKMPDIDGYEVCNELKKDINLVDIPIIFISALDDVAHKIKAFENGGVDYITKPFEPKEVLARIKTQLEIATSKKTIENLLFRQDMFIKKIMHELNTPLNVIGLNCESLEKSIGEKDELESIKASTKTLSSIYKDLAFLVKKESRVYERENINLCSFLQKRVMFFDEVARVKDIYIDLEYDIEYIIYISKDELERIIDNTISNAIKYSKESTTIIISVMKTENKILLKVKDEGIGIEETSSLFKPYYQQNSTSFGLGLGLNIVKEICDKYKINIDVQTEINKGSVFCFDLSYLIAE